MRKKKSGKIMLNKTPAHLFSIILALLFISACSVTQQGAGGDYGSKEPVHSTAYKNALSAMKNSEFKKAQSLLQDVINQQPNSSNAHVNLGIVHLKKNSLSEAENSFNHALRVNPNNVYALNQLGILYRQLGNFSAAKSYYEKAIDINSDYANAHLNLGVLYDLYLYDFPNAIEQYKIYQSLTKNKNKQVEKWIIDLERRLKKSLESKSK